MQVDNKSMELTYNNNTWKISSKSKDEIDKRYFDAINNGDTELTQRLVDDASRKAGYISNDEYRMQHQAPNRENDNLATVMDSDLVPSDYWTMPQYYQHGGDEFSSFYKIRDAIKRRKQYATDNVKAVVRLVVYRAIPKGVKDDSMRNGDWVTPSYEYAQGEGRLITGGYKIIKANARLEHLWWDANSINELGYDDGSNYVYQNTKNNR